MKFGHEDLEVWQKSVDFAVKVIDVIEEIDLPRKHFKLIDQIESSVTSVASNIAEGKGRNSKREYIQFMYIARGSLYETMTRLEVFRRKQWISNAIYQELEVQGIEIARMLMGLIKSISNSL